MALPSQLETGALAAPRLGCALSSAGLSAVLKPPAGVAGYQNPVTEIAWPHLYVHAYVCMYRYA